MAMEGKTLRKGGSLNESGKRYKKCQQLVQDQSLTMEKSWVMMMHQIDKKDKE